jgi:predicted DNA-binding transcriptional regulator YafY
MAPELDTRFVQFRYTNHRGETRLRRVVPRRIEFIATDWYPEPQWILFALDIDKAAERGFAMTRVHDWQQLVLR